MPTKRTPTKTRNGNCQSNVRVFFSLCVFVVLRVFFLGVFFFFFFLHFMLFFLFEGGLASPAGPGATATAADADGGGELGGGGLAFR